MFSIQFNSKTLFKDGDPVSLKLLLPGQLCMCTCIRAHNSRFRQVQLHDYKHLFKRFVNSIFIL